MTLVGAHTQASPSPVVVYPRVGLACSDSVIEYYSTDSHHSQTPSSHPSPHRTAPVLDRVEIIARLRRLDPQLTYLLERIVGVAPNSHSRLRSTILSPSTISLLPLLNSPSIAGCTASLSTSPHFAGPHSPRLCHSARYFQAEPNRNLHRILVRLSEAVAEHRGIEHLLQRIALLSYSSTLEESCSSRCQRFRHSYRSCPRTRPLKLCWTRTPLKSARQQSPSSPSKTVLRGRIITCGRPPKAPELIVASSIAELNPCFIPPSRQNQPP